MRATNSVLLDGSYGVQRGNHLLGVLRRRGIGGLSVMTGCLLQVRNAKVCLLTPGTATAHAIIAGSTSELRYVTEVADQSLQMEEFVAGRQVIMNLPTGKRIEEGVQLRVHTKGQRRWGLGSMKKPTGAIIVAGNGDNFLRTFFLADGLVLLLLGAGSAGGRSSGWNSRPSGRLGSCMSGSTERDTTTSLGRDGNLGARLSGLGGFASAATLAGGLPGGSSGGGGRCWTTASFGWRWLAPTALGCGRRSSSGRLRRRLRGSLCRGLSRRTDIQSPQRGGKRSWRGQQGGSGNGRHRANVRASERVKSPITAAKSIILNEDETINRIQDQQRRTQNSAYHTIELLALPSTQLVQVLKGGLHESLLIPAWQSMPQLNCLTRKENSKVRTLNSIQRNERISNSHLRVFVEVPNAKLQSAFRFLKMLLIEEHLTFFLGSGGSCSRAGSRLGRGSHESRKRKRTDQQSDASKKREIRNLELGLTIARGPRERMNKSRMGDQWTRGDDSEVKTLKMTREDEVSEMKEESDGEIGLRGVLDLAFIGEIQPSLSSNLDFLDGNQAFQE